MRKTMMLCFSLLLLLPLCHPAFGQESKPDSAGPSSKSGESVEDSRFFRFDFAIKEIGDDGKEVNSRTYWTIAASGRADRGASIRAGSKIPVYTSEKHEVQYIDLGVNIDIHSVHMMGSQVALEAIADVSSVGRQAGADAPQTPVIRQNRWNSSVLIPLNRSVVIFSSDDLNSKGKIQVELMATPLK